MKLSPLFLALILCNPAILPAQPVPQSSATPVISPTPKPTPLPRTPESAVTPAVKDPNRHVEFLDRKQRGPIDLLFLGDSITDFWPRRGETTWLKFAAWNPADFGISADRTEHVLWRITNGELDGIQPKVTVIMIGTNNVGQCPDEKPEWAAEGVKKIVATVHEKLPATKVLLLAVFPRDIKGSRLREAVAQINQSLVSLDDGKQTRFLDIGSQFLDAQGEIPSDVMPDKLHPNAKGYEIWYGAMQPLLSEMMAEK
ncbi:MAG: GDSL-type esterase/lipase family protein [Chthoniobacterales bacterium]